MHPRGPGPPAPVSRTKVASGRRPLTGLEKSAPGKAASSTRFSRPPDITVYVSVFQVRTQVRRGAVTCPKAHSDGARMVPKATGLVCKHEGRLRSPLPKEEWAASHGSKTTQTGAQHPGSPLPRAAFKKVLQGQ